MSLKGTMEGWATDVQAFGRVFARTPMHYAGDKDERWQVLLEWAERLEQVKDFALYVANGNEKQNLQENLRLLRNACLEADYWESKRAVNKHPQPAGEEER